MSDPITDWPIRRWLNALALGMQDTSSLLSQLLTEQAQTREVLIDIRSGVNALNAFNAGFITNQLPMIGDNTEATANRLDALIAYMLPAMLQNPGGVAKESTWILTQRIYDELVALNASASTTNVHLSAIEECGCDDSTPPVRPDGMPVDWQTWDVITLAEMSSRVIRVKANPGDYPIFPQDGATAWVLLGSNTYMANVINWTEEPPPAEDGYYAYPEPNGDSNFIYVAPVATPTGHIQALVVNTTTPNGVAENISIHWNGNPGSVGPGQILQPGEYLIYDYADHPLVDGKFWIESGSNIPDTYPTQATIYIRTD